MNMRIISKQPQKKLLAKMDNKKFTYTVIWTTINKSRVDNFSYDTYSKAVVRMDTLKSIFKSKDWKWNIIIKQLTK